ncbi:MAG TPA: (Fe-S)-binding protein [Gemmatimonadota bacterium]|nr:(Fe-S)-binding protein [Gemmatimonadota bacterium]
MNTERDLLAQCIQCGLCLPACPTYALTPRERANPRGRVGLMRAVDRGELAVDDPAFAAAMYYCLGCRACETACPAGVEFGRLLEGARAAVEEAAAEGRPEGFPRDWLLDHLLPYPRRLLWGARLLRLYQRTAARSRRWRGWFDDRFPEAAALAPLLPDVPAPRRTKLPSALEPDQVATDLPARRTRGTVALHPGCIQSALLPQINLDTMLVLAYNGWRVVVPRPFPCCGALHAHQGRPRDAGALARANIAVWEAAGAGRLVSNAAGCGAHLREVRHLLADDPEWADRAAAFSEAVVDVSDFLVREGVRRPRRPFSLRATYHDPCHLVHGQRVAEAPRLLLSAIPGLEMIPLVESTWCCGSAGIYNLTHPEAADELLRRKVSLIRATGAELVVTGNPGCILQIASGLNAVGSPVRVIHPASLLRVAYELSPRLRR